MPTDPRCRPGPFALVALVAASLIVIVGCDRPADAAATAAIELAFAPTPSPSLEVRGLPRALLAELDKLEAEAAIWGAVLPFHPTGLDGVDLPPIAGRYEVGDGVVRFFSQYGLAPGAGYRTTLDPRPLGGAGRDLGSPLTLETVVPARSGAAPQVVVIFPSADRVPENLLRLYLHFDRPMRTWGYLEHLALIDETTGQEAVGVFHQLDQGLWNASSTRLTVWLEPGRIKRGLRNHLELGPPLSAGHRYRLEVRPGWADAGGRSTETVHTHRFTVEAADRVSPRAATWSVTTPPAGSRQPLVVHFNESLDRALLARALEIRHGDRPIAGHWSIELQETGADFSPDQPWAPGTHALVADPRLEDLAGNNLVRLFDEDLRSPSSSTTAATWLEFRITEAATSEQLVKQSRESR